MNKSVVLLIVAILSGTVGFLISNTGVLAMDKKIAFKMKEPLLIAGEQKHFSILPSGTVLYFDKAWPEGHQTYHAYFHFKGELLADRVDPEMISPLWLRTVDPDELSKLMQNYPLTKDELVQILQARKVTKAELVQIVRDWPDDS